VLLPRDVVAGILVELERQGGDPEVRRDGALLRRTRSDRQRRIHAPRCHKWLRSRRRNSSSRGKFLPCGQLSIKACAAERNRKPA
jgi:hypothetical protein